MAFLPARLLAALALLALLPLPAPGPSGSQKKKEPRPKEPAPAAEKPYRAPPSMKKTILILSPYDEGLLRPITDFIEDATGLACRNLARKEGRATAGDAQFDLYIGPLMRTPPTGVYPYESPEWRGFDPSLRVNGVFIWSTWYSCLSLNTLVPVDPVSVRANALSALFGKLTAVDPGADLHTNAILAALRGRYGADAVRDIADSIPVYRNTREELVFAVESGQYAAVLGLEGDFRASIARGYPLAIDFGSLNAAKYPVTTVRGRNAAFIHRSAPNREGAEFLVDFMGQEAFQSFLAATPFVPLDPRLLAAKGVKTAYPSAVVDWVYDEADMRDARALWESLAFPEGVGDLVR
jgi:hypothetical protein